MQEKVVFDTNVYLGIFNRGRYREEINWLHTITYLVHPVLHELWIGAKGHAEIHHLMRFGNTCMKLGRLVQPTPSTHMLIGQVCQRLRVAGHLDPKQPRHDNDVCIAMLARQIGATVVTTDSDDFQRIHNVTGFRFRHVLEV